MGTGWGKKPGDAQKDELSGELTLAFSILRITEEELSGEFDSRCPICANEENTLKPAKAAMEKDGFVFSTESMSAPHHVSEDSEFVRTLLEAYEVYTGRKGGCVAIGGALMSMI